MKRLLQKGTLTRGIACVGLGLGLPPLGRCQVDSELKFCIGRNARVIERRTTTTTPPTDSDVHEQLEEEIAFERERVIAVAEAAAAAAAARVEAERKRIEAAAAAEAERVRVEAEAAAAAAALAAAAEQVTNCCPN